MSSNTFWLQNNCRSTWQVQLNRIRPIIKWLISWNHWCIFIIWLDSIMTTISLIVSILDIHMLLFPFCANFIILERLSWIEIKDKQQIASFKSNHFIFSILCANILVISTDKFMGVVKLNHVPIKIPQKFKSQQIIISQIPLSPTMLA